MPLCAAYARYSTDEQRATSIDDQLRRCRELAARHGLSVEDALVFSDSAVTGTSKGDAKRKGYRRLLDAIEARACDVVIADEVSRLTRSTAEGGRLIELVENTGVRFLTFDGIDTHQEGWKLLWLFKLTSATQEVDAAAFRTRRGMLGQLERGYQVAQAPYGYRPLKHFTPGGRVLGTTWVIEPTEAAVVQDIFARRLAGQSGPAIARMLNERQVLSPGFQRKDAAGFWRASAVMQLLGNSIYRGQFVWNGSTFAKHRAKKRRKVPELRAFERPGLRLVSDEVWYGANPGLEGRCTRTYRPRGGGTQLFSGLVRCADCGGLCSVGSSSKNRSLYCAQCEAACRAGGRPGWMGYSSVSAARQALRGVLQTVFAQGPVREALQRRLQERLQDGPRQEVLRLEAELRDMDARVDRLKRMMVDLRHGYEQFAGDFEAAVNAGAALRARLEQARSENARVDAQTVAAQTAVDAFRLLDALLEEGTMEPFKVRATLQRLLLQFEFVQRPAKGVSVFRIRLRPGVFLAEATNTSAIDHDEVGFEVRVSTTARRPVVWDVDVVALN